MEKMNNMNKVDEMILWKDLSEEEKQSMESEDGEAIFTVEVIEAIS